MRYYRTDPWPLRLPLMLSLFHHCIGSSEQSFTKLLILFISNIFSILVIFNKDLFFSKFYELGNSWNYIVVNSLLISKYEYPLIIFFWTFVIECPALKSNPEQNSTHMHTIWLRCLKKKTCYWEMSPAFIVTKKIILRPPLLKWHFSIFSLLPNFILSGKSTYDSQVCVY